MKQKKIPMRKCSGCSQMKEKYELIRVVRAPKNKECEQESNTCEISLDLTGKKPGRGAYLCRSLECFEMAKKALRFERAFSCKIPDEVYAKMYEELKASAEEDG